ncbi:bifunctional UDP-N-acetylglucosamine diphosphorylase/glucosamine-1-phosphate N-acetyltransferase GlmU [Sandaracinobacter neustonicus]|uniref:Bifunctional protein GlmU n=1 Tax=Sandaracinobacter neustonicus TaxID=1715348 RepID=A0A501XUG6_9SPHN|nr:bifunctional UDP-N-acetylglucosamine diphosphorylase/glucosamine-1-phosphate N-acetyltransferase GlmU [Sandaracinobacter neustonicus]TPE63764.1 bifunctional UDP-N-acetylglucosamine diphosphorylase/glucosamine-1-phosphate N-acetyltransferase GlmU [Sandaracinobacter neustonicus]
MAPVPARPVAAIILAAGKGTRMKSDLHKVLHPLGGRPMLMHLLASLTALAPERQVVVVGDKAEQLRAALTGSDVQLAVQEPQLGTGHAVLQAEAALAGFDGVALILFGDVPLVSGATMARLVQAVADGAEIAVLGFRPAVPGAYGRVIADADGRIRKMVEAKDATPEELAVPLCNAGLMAVDSARLFGLLKQVGNANAAGEYYLPDIVMLATAAGGDCRVLEAPPGEVLGVNSRGELAEAEALFQQRRRADLMAAGVTLTAPETVFLSFDTLIGRDTLVEPNVVFAPGVEVAAGATIRAFSHLEGARVATGCEVGPYARLRPGTVLETGAKVGNFVETKKAVLGPGAKANHLSYLGDATVGAKANIGAGTITCNYDGFGKYQTVIGEGAFIGSNSALVAPVTIGDGAIVGAGSTLTQDVAADALALVRPPQVSKAGWAARFRAAALARKGK